MAVNGKTCMVVDLGLIAYDEAFALQRRLVAARKSARIPDILLLSEHPHVITLGRNGKREHLLGSARLLEQMGVSFSETNRGGDITYHGPGQLVGYPILDLSGMRKDVVWYVRSLEEAMIRASADFGIAARRSEGKTGVWVETAPGAVEKLAAIGVHISRWVTSHGFAYNVSTDLRYFDLIVPCGIPGCRTSSLEKLLGRDVSLQEFAPACVRHFGGVFGVDMRSVPREELAALLARAGDEESRLATVQS